MSLNEQHKSEGVFAGRNIIVIYTMLSILVKMKEQLGLEAMLEYINTYLRILGEGNPKMQSAVHYALALMSVEKMYHDALQNEKKF